MNKDEREQIEVVVSKLYYIEKMQQDEIAIKLNISKSSVSRILKKAISDGVVTIHINDSLSRLPYVASTLQRNLGLKNVYIAETSKETELTKNNVAALVAQVLELNLKSGMLLGVGRGNITSYVARNLAGGSNIRVDTVQMVGNIYSTVSNIEGSRLVSRFSAKLLGSAHLINAPLMVSNKSIRELLVRETVIQKTISLFSKLQVGLFEIEQVHSNISMQLGSDWLTRADMLQLRDTNAVANVLGIFFDSTGQSCSIGINDRRIGIDSSTISKVPVSIGMAAGVNLKEATLAVIKSGLINSLVIDEELAIALCN